MKNNDSCSKHPLKVQTYNGTNYELVNEFQNVNYLGLAEFTKALSTDILHQSLADKERRRYKLSEELYQTSISLKLASDYLLEVHSVAMHTKIPNYNNKTFMINNYIHSYSTLAKDVGRLRYKETREIMQDISILVRTNAEKTMFNETGKNQMNNAIIKLFLSQNHMNNAWLISKPFMTEKSMSLK
ncbi:MAG: hypothetical protein ACP5N1_01310 [Candidatus Woesearchaeota archaeon]